MGRYHVALALAFAFAQLVRAQDVTAMTYSPDGSVLIYSGLHGRLELVDGFTRRDIWHTQAHIGGTYGMAISPNGSQFATWGADNKIKVWKLKGNPIESAQEISAITGEDVVVAALAFSPDGRILASGGYDNKLRQTIRFWDVGARKQLAKLELLGHKGRTMSLSFSPDGKVLASTGSTRVEVGPRITSEDDEIQLWDTAKFALLGKVPHRAHNTAFTPDSRFLVSVGHYLKRSETETLLKSDGEVSVWDMIHLRTVFQKKDFQRALALSRDGQWLATCLGSGLHGNGIVTYDTEKTKGVQIWEMASGQPVLWKKLEHNEQAVVAFSPDATRLAVGHKAGNVTIHRLSIGEWLPGLRLGPAQEDWWASLAGDDAPLAFEAICLFEESGDKAISFLREQLPPAVAPNQGDIRKLIKNLSDGSFKVRDTANRELTRLGRVIEGELRRALQEKLDLETQRRVHKLLTNLTSHPASSEELRQSRAVAILGRIGTKGARQHLERLAKGNPSAWLTQEAQNRLQFLEVQ